MAEYFSSQYQWLWTLVMGAVLFYPARQMIWVLMIRRHQGKEGSPPGKDDSLRFKKRAAVTSALLCFVFSVIYVNFMFRGE